MKKGLSRPVDESIAAGEFQAKRKAKKSSAPDDNHSDHYVTGLEKYRSAGKGDKYRPIEGWHSPEMTDKLNKIFGKNGKKKKTKP